MLSRSADVWRTLSRANASVQLFRGANGQLGVGAAWARAHRRRTIFAGANNADLNLDTFSGPRDPRRRMFTAGLRMTDAMVVQTDVQIQLAGEHVPFAPAPEQINSFVAEAPAATAPGEAFLWVSRLVDYKRPLLYADLAEAVPEAQFWMVAIKTEDDSYADTLAELQRRSAVLDNFELLPQRSHGALQELIGQAVAMVNTSRYEGMPNAWLEGWARGIPALTLSFDPDDRIARHDLGIAAEGSWDAFVAGARRLWERHADRGELSSTVRAYVQDVHGRRVGDRWAEVVRGLL
jgi:glycosyltransferase involved in cell wall biosynthesis